MRKEEKIMNYADIKIADVANGKGVREVCIEIRILQT